MRVAEGKGSVKRFRRTAWRFQCTFRVPLEHLSPFVAAIVSALRPIERAIAIIDSYAFPPRNLLSLLARSSIALEAAHDVSIEAAGQEEMQELLQAMLSDWLDFIFIPEPNRIAMYADHDEYITFFPNSKASIDSLTQALAGFQQVRDYHREL